MPNNATFNSAYDDFSQGPPTQRSGKAIASLICGLLSLVTCFLTGVPAFILGLMGLSDIGRSEGRLTGKGMAIFGMLLGVIGTSLTVVMPLVALLLPAIGAAREAARRAQTTMHMKQIAVAIQEYETTNGKLPWAAHGEDGKPPVSWRVRILPFLEEGALYSQYRLDEPWNSEHNRTLLDLMPDVFKSAGDEDGNGRTNFAAIVGNDTVWPPEGDFKLRDAHDGRSTTILFIESRGLDIPWMEPRDMSIDDFAKGINQPGGPQTSSHSGLLVALADLAVIRLSDDTSPKDLRALATASGGESVWPRTD